jgi:hypothetical protein
MGEGVCQRVLEKFTKRGAGLPGVGQGAAEQRPSRLAGLGALN